MLQGAAIGPGSAAGAGSGSSACGAAADVSAAAVEVGRQEAWVGPAAASVRAGLG